MNVGVVSSKSPFRFNLSCLNQRLTLTEIVSMILMQYFAIPVDISVPIKILPYKLVHFLDIKYGTYIINIDNIFSDVVWEQKSGSGRVQGLLFGFGLGLGINISGMSPSGFQVF